MKILLSGLKTKIASVIRNEKAIAINVGCHENKPKTKFM